MRARRCGRKNVTKDIHGFGAKKNTTGKRRILEMIQQMIWMEKVKTSRIEMELVHMGQNCHGNNIGFFSLGPFQY